MRKRVQIFLSTHNGEKYLEEQIESLIQQKNVELSILVRDDFSTDGTKEILNKYQKNKLLTWYTGLNLGPAKSFMDLLTNASDADYYAFCDQDDVWGNTKLSTAIDFLKKSKKPSIYFSNVEVVNSSLNHISYSSIKCRLTFGESLVRNSAIGCTVVFNPELLALANKYSPDYLLMHDSWLLQLCLAVNGDVFLDKNPSMKYRQHANNVVGKESINLKIKRRYNIFFKNKGGARLLNAKSILSGYGNILPEENRILLEFIINYKGSFSKKIRTIFNPNFRTAYFESNLGFIISILLNKY